MTRFPLPPYPFSISEQFCKPILPIFVPQLPSILPSFPPFPLSAILLSLGCHIPTPFPSSFPPFRSRIAQKSNEFIGQVELPGKRVAKRNPCFPIRCDLCSPFTPLSRSNVARYCFPPRLVGEKGGEARNFSGLLISSKGTKECRRFVRNFTSECFHPGGLRGYLSNRILRPSLFSIFLERGGEERGNVCFILFWEIWEKVDTSIEIR